VFLEVEAKTGADAALILAKISSEPSLQEIRAIALRQQVAHSHQRIEMA